MLNNSEPLIELDATRLLCPLPVIRLQNKIKTLPSNCQLFLRCTDPGTWHDVPTWCRLFGHTVLKTEEVNDEIHFYIQVTQGEAHVCATRT